MHIYDYSFLDNGLLPADFVGLAGEIHVLREKASAREQDYPKAFTALESIARVQSVKASNAIEGIVTSDARIASIVEKSTAPRNHDEEEIAGYRDALAIVHENHDTLSLSPATILNLHRTMMSYTADPDAGAFKTADNLIVEIDANGRRRVRFDPVSAAEAPDAVEQLCLAFLDARGNARINQLLLIPCVVLDFLCIHPFRDGNGRISRLLTLLLMYQSGFMVGRYISFEEQVNAANAAYYQALEQSSAGWHENENDYIPFMRNFLVTLYRCYSELNSRFAAARSGHVSKSARIKATVLESIVPISKRDICQMLPDVSVTTVEAVLGSMVREGSIRKIGAGPATRYLRIASR